MASFREERWCAPARSPLGDLLRPGDRPGRLDRNGLRLRRLQRLRGGGERSPPARPPWRGARSWAPRSLREWDESLERAVEASLRYLRCHVGAEAPSRAGQKVASSVGPRCAARQRCRCQGTHRVEGRAGSAPGRSPRPSLGIPPRRVSPSEIRMTRRERGGGSRPRLVGWARRAYLRIGNRFTSDSRSQYFPSPRYRPAPT